MVFITGHRNPDMDSTCSAYCYAELKNTNDSNETYKAIRCGALNKQTKYVFERAGLKPPRLMADVYPRVSDVAKTDIVTLNESEPVHQAIEKLDEFNISVIPIMSEAGVFAGIVSVHEISQFFLTETAGTRPDYLFYPRNFEKVLPGRFLKTGKDEEFTTCTMIGAMPYTTGIRRMRELFPKKPVLVVGLRKDLIQYAVDENFPAIILTGVDADEMIPFDFSSYTGWVYISDRDTAETIRLIRLSTPIRYIMNSDPIRLSTADLFETARDRLVNSDYRGLPVFENDKFFGIVTRRCFIERPAKKLILVDHNELSQSIPGSENAEIREIIDHHRLAAEKTRQPIYVYAKPVGSTCTLVYQHFLHANTPLSAATATLLLAGVLSDTVSLKSPTTTKEDRTAVEALAALAGLESAAFAQELFSHAHDLLTVDLNEVVTADFKTYDEFGFSVGIGQIEVTTLENFEEVKPRVLEVLETVRFKQRLDWALLLVTNVLKETSLLLVTDSPVREHQLIYKKIGENTYDLPGILSRKKQLLPEILRVLEETREASAG